MEINELKTVLRNESKIPFNLMPKEAQDILLRNYRQVQIYLKNANQ